MNYVKQIIEKIKIRKWPTHERNALFRIIYEIYNSDGDFNSKEKQDFNKRSFGLGIEIDEIKNLNFNKAIETLKRSSQKMKIVHFWIATSIFADDDYDKVEQAFVDTMISKYKLNESDLRSIIKTIRDKKIDEELRKMFPELDD